DPLQQQGLVGGQGVAQLGGQNPGRGVHHEAGGQADAPGVEGRDQVGEGHNSNTSRPSVGSLSPRPSENSENSENCPPYPSGSGPVPQFSEFSEFSEVRRDG